MARRCAVLALLVLTVGCGRLRLPAPDVEGRSADGRSVVYTFGNGETLRVPIRRPSAAPATDPTPCSAALYLELGSLTYVSATIAEAQRARHDAGEPPLMGAELTAMRVTAEARLSARRAEMGYGDPQAFLDALSDDDKNADGVPHPRTIRCDLTLQPSDVVLTSLRYAGPASSNRRLSCECDSSVMMAGGPPRCGRLASPFSAERLREMAGDGVGEPPVLSFRPTNCGVSGPQDASGALRVRCDPVTGVSVDRCTIDGRISAGSFGGDMALYSSPADDHVPRLQQSAAQHLTFSDMTIRGRYRTPIHLLPGTHHVTVQRSRIVGGYVFSAVYLPADGGWNTLRDNVILGHSAQWQLDLTEPTGGRREVIAIDSSEHNRIIGNHIQRIRYGGIYLFRNCGERNMIRQRAPQYNHIVHNVFDYGGESPSHPAIFIGSRDDIPLQPTGVKKYCDEDLGPDNRPYPGNDTRFPWDVDVVPNSSESNDDWAGHNVVAQNRFTGFAGQRGLRDFVRLSERAARLDSNWVDRNMVVADAARAVGELRRPAGCAVHDGIVNGYTPFVTDGVVIDVFERPRPPIRLVCGPPLRCEDGDLVEAPPRACGLRTDTEPCRIEGVNRDCVRRASCPSGTRLVGMQAACNLEHGAVSDAQLDAVPMDRIEVVRPSGRVDDGRCWVNGTSIREGRAKILDAQVGTDVVLGCREHDRNGADCHVRVRYYCAPPR